MLQWMVIVRKPDLSVTVVSFNLFGACPREYHLQLAIRVFGYVKTITHKKIAIESHPMDFSRDTPEYKKLRPDFLQDYPDATEEIDTHFPYMFGPVLQSTFFVESNHAHDKFTRKSLTGFIGFVGSIPVTWGSKYQGSITSSTYASEFSALSTAIE